MIASEYRQQIYIKKPHSCSEQFSGIKTLRNKFESVQAIIKDAFDIFLVSEIEIDSSITDWQFNIQKQQIFQKDRNNFGGGLSCYIRQYLN